MVIARFAGRSQWLSGAKKTPGRDCSEGCPKFPVSGQPSNGEGSLPCRLFPPDFLCQALRKSTCVKLQNQDPKISNHTDRLNATAYEAQPAITAVKDQKRTFPDSFWGFAASAGRPGAPTLFFERGPRHWASCVGRWRCSRLPFRFQQRKPPPGRFRIGLEFLFGPCGSFECGLNFSQNALYDQGRRSDRAQSFHSY
jgi:hypothetical protein